MQLEQYCMSYILQIFVGNWKKHVLFCCNVNVKRNVRDLFTKGQWRYVMQGTNTRFTIQLIRLQ